jgi:D-alanyl-lipoteichoic acid acyltransferase DltB (MBOAT superfamily)
LITYALRTVGILLSFEIFTYFSHSYALMTNPANADIISKVDLMVLGNMGCWCLYFIWYKFLSIWRIFRTVALLDGFEVPENMQRFINYILFLRNL